ncbi:MAG: hypothetical protein ACRDQA_24410 [Nocardioidaceae bacterium]
MRTKVDRARQLKNSHRYRAITDFSGHCIDLSTGRLLDVPGTFALGFRRWHRVDPATRFAMFVLTRCAASPRATAPRPFRQQIAAVLAQHTIASSLTCANDLVVSV